MDENQILAHGAVRNCATGPLKFDCHSGIDQQSTEMADLTSAGAQQESRAQAKKSTGSDEMEQKPKHTGRPRVRSLRKLKAHSQKKFSPLSMQYPGPQFRTRQHKTVVTTAGRSDISAANSCKRHQQNRAKTSRTLRLGVVLATFRSRSECNRQRPPGYVRESLEKTDPAPRSARIAHHLSLCAFWHFQSTRKASRQGMTNHATHTTPRARESIGPF